MANSSRDVLFDTLEDGAWLDSFDKLICQRPALRPLNVDVHARAAFNMDSSVENSVQFVPAVVPSVLVNGRKRTKKVRKKSAKTKRSIATTPISKLANPFKCSLSPVGTWKSLYFDKNKKKNPYSEQFHGTPIDPKTIVADYTAEEAAAANALHPPKAAAANEFSPLLIPRRISKPKTNARPHSQRHVCFESLVENEPVPPTEKTSVDIISQRKHSSAAVRQEKLNDNLQRQSVNPSAEETAAANTLHHTKAAAALKLSPLLIPHRISKPKAKGKSHSQRHVCFESVVENEPLPPAEKTSEDIITQRKHSSAAVRQEELNDNQQRPTSLTLQPGKWRKSVNLWRRTQQNQQSPADNRRSLKHCSRNISVLENSVQLLGATSAPAVDYLRKSVLEKSERPSPRTWEKHVLERCGQRRPLPFERIYNADKMPNCRKIGEGAYGEVFLNNAASSSTVLKVIPIEGELEINGEVQKTFEQILPEIIISMELCNLGQDAVDAACQVNLTHGFIGIERVTCVKGKYPAHFIKQWEEYDDEKCSENDKPDVFPSSQLYIVLELAFGGKDLEAFVFNNAEQSYHALLQIILTLAVGEAAFQFEHRDLHWGNILILNTSEKHLKYKLDDKSLTLPTKGVRITIIDYTLSRMTFGDICYYNDLAADEELFKASGDYQFDIYRMMRDVLRNNWETFEPKTNVFWISYIIAKMIDGVSYKNSNTQRHLTYINKLKQLQQVTMDYKSAVDLAKYLQKVWN